MKFRPCIDIHNGKVKQIVGSTLSDKNDTTLVTNFETDLKPSYFAEMYKNDGLFGGHIIMLGPGNESAALDALRGFPHGLHVGGGITPDNANLYIDNGASHVIVTSYIFSNGEIVWKNLENIVAATGKKRLVLDLSCKKKDDRYYIATNRWQKLTGVFVSKETLETLADYCDEFLVHAAHVEGMKNGVDQDLIALLAQYSPIPVTYAGGVRSLSDLDIVNIRGGGRVDATVGSSLDIFGGALPYADVVAWHNTHQRRDAINRVSP